MQILEKEIAKKILLPIMTYVRSALYPYTNLTGESKESEVCAQQSITSHFQLECSWQ